MLSSFVEKPAAPSLIDLVKTNNLVELKNSIRAQKLALGNEAWSWRFNEKNTKPAIKEAISLGNLEIVKLLLEEGVSADTWVYENGNNGPIISLLELAVTLGNLAMVELLINYGARFYQDNYREHNNNGPIRAAVKNRQTDIVKYLLERGASANGNCEGGMYGYITFLAQAILNNDSEIIKLLIAHGANVLLTIQEAHEKLYEHGYREYEDYLHRDLSESNRIDKIMYALFYELRPNFYFDYSLKPAAKEFLQKLNAKLIHLADLKNNAQQKINILDFINNEITNSFPSVKIDQAKLSNDLNHIIDSLQEFDGKQAEIEKLRDEQKEQYLKILKTAMDYAVGENFKKRTRGFFSDEHFDLLEFTGLDIAGINFIGVSFEGKPITRELLKKLNLQGADNAIVTLSDLNQLADKERQNIIQNQLDSQFEKIGKMPDENGIVNLTSLARAAAQNNFDMVSLRLQAGADPNINKDYNVDDPLISAAKHGNMDMVMLLVDAHLHHTENKSQELFEQAKTKLLTTNDTKGVYIHNGEIQRILPDFSNENYFALMTEKNYHAAFPGTQKESLQDLNQKITQLINEVHQTNANIIFVVNYRGTLKATIIPNQSQAGKKAANEAFIAENQSSCEYCPTIFIDKENLTALKVIIEKQYQKIDKGKKLIVEAIEAARKNNHTEIVTYLESLQDINEKNSEGNTLLHKAVQQKDMQRMQFLIKKGADVNIQNNNRESPLSIAVQHSSDISLEMIKLLLSQNATVHLMDLSATIRYSLPQNLALLLPAFDKKDSRKTKFKRMDEENFYEPWYVDLMFEAIRHKNNVELLTLLKNHGADFNVKNEYGDTLLNNAIYYLPSFSDIRQTMGELQRSIAGCEERAQGMINNSYQKLIEDSRKHFEKALQLFNYLIDNGANPGLANQSEQTPLYTLIKDKDLQFLIDDGYKKILEKLLTAGADVNAQDKNGNTPLHAAALTGDIDAINFLITHGAKLNLANCNDKTPLHLAAQCCFPRSVKALIEAGSDTRLCDNDNHTPLQLLEDSYQEKREELNDDYQQKKWEMRNASYGFFSSNSSYDFHKYFRDKIQNLDDDYLNAKSAFAAVKDEQMSM